MNVGKQIRTIRESKGISQSELAKNAGISQPALCQIERGTKNPSLQIGGEIARLLECTVEELLTDE